MKNKATEKSDEFLTDKNQTSHNTRNDTHFEQNEVAAFHDAPRVSEEVERIKDMVFSHRHK